MAEYRDSLDYGTRRQYDAYWTPERLAAARVAAGLPPQYPPPMKVDQVRLSRIESQISAGGPGDIRSADELAAAEDRRFLTRADRWSDDRGDEITDVPPTG